jgi:putative DNA primase/helicase
MSRFAAAAGLHRVVDTSPQSRQVRRARERAALKSNRTNGSIAIGEADPFPATEAGDAEYFARLVDGHLLRDHQRRQWFVFGPHHWRRDTTNHVVQLAIDAMRSRQSDALRVTDSSERTKRLRWAVAGESEARIRHLLDLAGSHPRLAIEGTEWDWNGWTLGVTNGIADLRTATLRPSTPEDRVTRVAAVAFDPAATCPKWDRFVMEICNDDADLAAFLQRSTGYALTGVTSEQCFWVLFGNGSNGKTTFIETLTRHVVPEHSWTMSFPVNTWAESLGEYQKAELVGRRIVVAKESEQAKPLNTEFIKSLTGTETVNARHPYGRPFTFMPKAKFFLAANHRPIIRDETHGMWRRVRLVPFARTFPVNTAFAETLATEAPGILTWAIRGCLAWQAEGLRPAPVVKQATEEYRHQSDLLTPFLEARCVVADHAQVRAGTLFDTYRQWCQEQQISDTERLNQRTFGERMKQRFHAAVGQRVTYIGVGLGAEAPDET